MYYDLVTIRRVYAVLAGITWFALALGWLLTIFNVYPVGALDENTLGDNPDGLAGAFGRLIDSLSYFTNVSLVIVAVVSTMLARNPDRGGAVWRAVRMDSLTMISITGLIYAILLAPDAEVQGLDIITNALKHYIVPIVTVLVFLIIGPRRQVSLASVFTALVIPITWAAYTLVRGEVIQAYPYGFLNVIAYGLPAVLVNIAGVAALGIVMGLIFWALDRVLGRRTSTTKVG